MGTLVKEDFGQPNRENTMVSSSHFPCHGQEFASELEFLS